MNIEIIPVYKYLGAYVTDVENRLDTAEALWSKYAIDPYWERLCQFAPHDLSDRKPKPITDMAILKKQIEILDRIDLTWLKNEFQNVAALLPNYDDDSICVALYPLSDDNFTVKKLQNGVVGASTFGHMLININPLADSFLQWVPYVFAHEYHHTVRGNYWYAINGGKLEHQFVNSLLIDGEADSFALSVYPDLKPKWLFDMSEELEQSLWEHHYSKIVLEQDVDYGKYMFGDHHSGIPWCAGYAIGYRIVQRFIAKNPQITFKELLEKRPIDIFLDSEYEALSLSDRNREAQ